VCAHEAVDGGLQVDDGMEDAMLERAACQLGEEALDGIEPRAGGGREMKGPARMADDPRADLVLLVRGVVVEDDMDAAADAPEIRWRPRDLAGERRRFG